MVANVDAEKDWGNTAKRAFEEWSPPSSSHTGYNVKIPNKLEAKSSKAEFLIAASWGNLAAPYEGEISIRVNEVENKLEKLSERIKEITKYINATEPEEIVIREISSAQAGREIGNYFKEHHGENISAADLEEALGIDFDLASSICERLEQEGKIKGV